MGVCRERPWLISVCLNWRDLQQRDITPRDQEWAEGGEGGQRRVGAVSASDAEKTRGKRKRRHRDMYCTERIELGICRLKCLESISQVHKLAEKHLAVRRLHLNEKSLQKDLWNMRTTLMYLFWSDIYYIYICLYLGEGGQRTNS